MNNTLCGEITGDSGHILGSSLWRGCLYRSCRLEHILQSFEKLIFLFRSWIFGYITRKLCMFVGSSLKLDDFVGAGWRTERSEVLCVLCACFLISLRTVTSDV